MVERGYLRVSRRLVPRARRHYTGREGCVGPGASRISAMPRRGPNSLVHGSLERAQSDEMWTLEDKMSDRKAMVRTWEAHTAAEFVTRDVDAAMQTMTDNPTVLHLPTGMGATGFDGVRDFYQQWFVGRNAADMSIELISQTIGDTSIVDEMLITLTHDIEIPWILPAVVPTGKQVRFPVIGIVGFEGAAIA